MARATTAPVLGAVCWQRAILTARRSSMTWTCVTSVVMGALTSGACNFNPDATIESGLCEYSSCAGCLDPEACNFDVYCQSLDAGEL